MIAEAAVKTCPHCAELERSGTTTAFEHKGVRHVAPEIWMVGRRRAIELAGGSATEAIGQACREWADHCLAIMEGRS